MECNVSSEYVHVLATAESMMKTTVILSIMHDICRDNLLIRISHSAAYLRAVHESKLIARSGSLKTVVQLKTVR